MFTVNKNPSPSDLRKFGWAMLIGFGVLMLLFGSSPWWRAWWKGEALPVLGWAGTKAQLGALVLGFLGLVLWAISLAAPGVAKPIYVTWMTVTMPIGAVMSTVLLTVIYVFVLPPFSLIVRHKDPLRRKRTRTDSYWEDYKPHEPTIERMRRPF